MAGATAMRRLASVQQLQEQQARAALEVGLRELRHLQALLHAEMERERAGRRLIAAAVFSGEKTDWVAGQEEVRVAHRLGDMLKVRIAETEREAAELRETLLARRVERRQTEILVEQAEAHATRESARRAQQSTDEWFLNQSRRARAEKVSRTASVPQGSSLPQKS